MELPRWGQRMRDNWRVVEDAYESRRPSDDSGFEALDQAIQVRGGRLLRRDSAIASDCFSWPLGKKEKIQLVARATCYHWEVSLAHQPLTQNLSTDCMQDLRILSVVTDKLKDAVDAKRLCKATQLSRSLARLGCVRFLTIAWNEVTEDERPRLQKLAEDLTSEHKLRDWTCFRAFELFLSLSWKNKEVKRPCGALLIDALWAQCDAHQPVQKIHEGHFWDWVKQSEPKTTQYLRGEILWWAFRHEKIHQTTHTDQALSVAIREAMRCPETQSGQLARLEIAPLYLELVEKQPTSSRWHKQESKEVISYLYEAVLRPPEATGTFPTDGEGRIAITPIRTP